MSTKRSPREPDLVREPDGTWLAKWPVATVRFMFDDGTTADVTTTRDDSDLRAAVLRVLGKQGIAGSTVLPVEQTLALGDDR